MRKILFLLVMGLFGLMSHAIPADPAPVKVTQPDSTETPPRRRKLKLRS